MTPEQRRRAVRALLVIAPFGAAFSAGLAAIQRAEPWIMLLLAGITALGCLAAAVLIWLRGSKAGSDAQWLLAILRLFSR